MAGKFRRNSTLFLQYFKIAQFNNYYIMQKIKAALVDNAKELKINVIRYLPTTMLLILIKLVILIGNL